VIHQEYAKYLTEKDAVNFKTELVRDKTDKVVGTFDNITYNINNLTDYNNINYCVNCSGIKPGEYYLRLVTTVNDSAEYALVQIEYNDVKLQRKTIKEYCSTVRQFPKHMH
jgi:hypothetical protein